MVLEQNAFFLRVGFDGISLLKAAARPRKYRKHGHRNNVYIVLSGGTNELSKKLSNQCGVRVNGVAVGTYARDIIESQVQNPGFYSDDSIILEAYKIANKLVISSVEEKYE